MTAFKDWLNGLTSKTTPVDADEVYVRDSSGTPSSKKLTWANLKATLKTYFDGLYLSVTGGTISGVLTLQSDVAHTGTGTNPAKICFISGFGPGTGFRVGAYNAPTTSGNAATAAFYYSNNTSWSFGVNSAGSIGFGSTTYLGTEMDVVLRRDAANTLAQRNGTDAQTSRLYGTYTDGSNYRRVAISMTTGGVASIAPEGAGTGASGNVLHISGLPTSNPGAGILWNDSGTVKVGT